MDRRERYSDPEETMRAAFDGNQSKLWTALPGIIQSFDPDRMVASVQPSISGVAQNQDGTYQSIQLPVLLDCPVFFPSGGGVTLTFPLSAGDECLVVFASRCIDSWWQLGGVQGQAELRMHDLSDGFALPGVRSQPRKITVAMTGVQLRTDDGAAFIELDPGSHNVIVTTPGNVTINAPLTTINGALTVNGLLTYTQGLAGSGGSGSTASIDGNVNVNGTVTASTDVIGGGKSLKSHVHSGVQGGSSNTGTPV